MFILMVVGRDPIIGLAEVLLRPLDCCPNLKLVFVMVITPVCFNAFQVWVTDNFLRKKPASQRRGSYEIERDGGMQTRIRHDGGL